MFRRRTLFVLGAGTSAEVNLPLGTQLAQNISRKLDIRFERGYIPAGTGDFELYDLFRNAYSGERDKYQQAAWLIRDGIQLSGSIDDFLDLHRDNHRVVIYGKAAIVKSILEAERQSKLFVNRSGSDINLDFESIADTWFVKFMKMLGRGISRQDVGEIFANVSFIVFNYDRCLEHFLYHALQRLYGIDEPTAQEICGNLHIIHPYGSVGGLSAKGILEVPFGGVGIRDVLKVANGIQTYTEKISDETALSNIKTMVISADAIVFLGFAYHDQNMNMILRNVQKMNLMPVFGTAYGMSLHDTAVVTRQIETLFSPKLTRLFNHPDPSLKIDSPVIIKNDLTCAKLFDHFAKSLPGSD
jgi:hypothetical protein